MLAVDGEVYQVREWLVELGFHIETVEAYGKDHYEYEVWLLKDGKVVDQWNSFSETYNGQPLTQEKAQAAIAEIARDIAAGVDPAHWFNV